jgi:hypothetical protein
VLEIKDDEFWKKLVSDANIACDSSLGAQMLISKLLNIRDSKTFQKVFFFFYFKLIFFLMFLNYFNILIYYCFLKYFLFRNILK